MMTGAEFDSYIEETKAVGPAKHAALLLTRTLTPATDVAALLLWPFQLLIDLGNEAAKVNGLDKEAVDRAEKN